MNRESHDMFQTLADIQRLQAERLKSVDAFGNPLGGLGSLPGGLGGNIFNPFPFPFKEELECKFVNIKPHETDIQKCITLNPRFVE